MSFSLQVVEGSRRPTVLRRGGGLRGKRPPRPGFFADAIWPQCNPRLYQHV